jgi:uncharacterized protein (DUF427 family)
MDKVNTRRRKSVPLRRSPLAGFPDHAITVTACATRISILFNGETIADSYRTLVLSETGYRPVYYFPRKDVRMDLLQPSEHRSHCPFKGDAVYWTLKSGNRVAENAAWSYEVPYWEVAKIKDYLVFDLKRMDDWHVDK